MASPETLDSNIPLEQRIVARNTIAQAQAVSRAFANVELAQLDDDEIAAVLAAQDPEVDKQAAGVNAILDDARIRRVEATIAARKAAEPAEAPAEETTPPEPAATDAGDEVIG